MRTAHLKHFFLALLSLLLANALLKLKLGLLGASKTQVLLHQIAEAVHQTRGNGQRVANSCVPYVLQRDSLGDKVRGSPGTPGGWFCVGGSLVRAGSVVLAAGLGRGMLSREGWIVVASPLPCARREPAKESSMISRSLSSIWPSGSGVM